MPSTHTCLLYHLVFSTKNRHPWITEPWEKRLHGYLGGILHGLGGIAECVGGATDHVHILASLKATHCLAEVMRDLKSGSSHWVHEAVGIGMFSWQDGYGAFTVGRPEVDPIKRYIRQQKEHHRRKSFKEEYLEILRQSGLDIDERYIW
jgi:putative transposase